MTEALAVQPQKEIAAGADKNIYESLALRGDLSGLNPQDKAIYLQKLCESLGMNPYTQPFIPLKLNGKEILYASRGATDQLASVHKLTREIIKTEMIQDVYIATCKVSSPDGRFDISTGAVTIGNLKGDALANALMKAETKSKRRATLCFCGLGFLDESELETIPANRFDPPTKGQLTQSAPQTSSGSPIRDHHLKKERENPVTTPPVIDAEIVAPVDEALSAEWRKEIEKLSVAIGKSAETVAGTLNFFDANPDRRLDCLTKVRRTFIKETIASDLWDLNGAPMTEQQTHVFLDRFGIKAIDQATAEQVSACAAEIWTQIYDIPF